MQHLWLGSLERLQAFRADDEIGFFDFSSNEQDKLLRVVQNDTPASFAHMPHEPGIIAKHQIGRCVNPRHLHQFRIVVQLILFEPW